MCMGKEISRKYIHVDILYSETMSSGECFKI